MKQIKKHVLLLLCIVACLFSLTACGQASQEEEGVDPMISGILTQQASSFLEQVIAIPEDQLDQVIEQNRKGGIEAIASGLEGYIGVKNDLGAFVSAGEGRVREIDDGYEITIDTVFEKRACAFALTVDEEMTTVSSMSFNPVYTTGEKMAKAGMNTLMGMGTVFLVLIFICLLISCFKYIGVLEENMKKKGAAPVKAAAPAAKPAAAPVPPAPVPVEIPLPFVPATDDEEMEMLAILTAIMEDTRNNAAASNDSLVARARKRRPGSRWKNA